MPKIHGSTFFRTCSLDSEFLASTSTDGSARIWKTDDGVPITSLTRNSVCYILATDSYTPLLSAYWQTYTLSFYRMKSLNYVVFPRMVQSHFCFALFKRVRTNLVLHCSMLFQWGYYLSLLFATGFKAVTSVWDISNWTKIGHKRLLRKPASVMSISLDGKYLAQ